jgi:hypothetical protein
MARYDHDSAGDLLQGLAVPSSRISPDTLIATDAGTAASSYTQAGPGPGQAIPGDADSQLVLEVSGHQEEDLEVQVRTAGLPGREALGLGVVWRLDSETSDGDWRGRAEPNMPREWLGAVPVTAAEEYTGFDVCVVRDSQSLVLVYADNNANAELKARVFDWGNPGTTGAAWGPERDASKDATAGTDGDIDTAWRSVTCCALPSGRVIALAAPSGITDLRVFCSDNGGNAWQSYADRAAVVSNVIRMRAVYYRGDIALFTQTSTLIGQYASNDEGTTFDGLTGKTWTGYSVAADAMPDNSGILVAYKSASNKPCVRRIAAAYQPAADADEIEIDGSNNCDELCLAIDGNGVAYVAARDAGTPGLWRVYYSEDGGSTWTRQEGSAGATWGLFRSSDDFSMSNSAAVFANGYMVIAHNCSDVVPEANANAIGSLFAGGWGGYTLEREGSYSSGRNHPRSYASTAHTDGGTWIGIQAPDDDGWTAGGAASGGALSNGVCTISAAGAADYFDLTPTTAGDGILFMASHGTDATPVSSAFEEGILVRCADGSTDYQVQIRCSATDLVVWDVHGAIEKASASLNQKIGETWGNILVYVQSSGLIVAVAQAFDTRWRVVYESGSILGSDLTEKGSARASTNLIRVGVHGSISADSAWRFMAWRTFSSGQPVRLGLDTNTSLPDDVGGSLSTLGVPLPGVGSSTAAAFLAAKRGPGRRGETITIPVAYTHAVENLFPALSPSPDVRWRSTSKAEQILSFDLGYLSKPGLDWIHVLGMLRTNFRQAFLEASVSGSSWTQIGEWDAGVQFIDYRIEGDWVCPEQNGDSVSAQEYPRPLFRNELAGGYVVLDGADALSVLANSAGSWGDPGDATKHLEIRVDSPTGGESETGSIEVVWPNAVMVARQTGTHPDGAGITRYRYWRIRIPANQPTPFSYYEIGAVILGDGMIFGRQTSRGWSQAMRSNVVRSKSRYGTIRKKRNGPPARRWAMSWTDGLLAAFYRAQVPGYLSQASGAAPLAIQDDVWLSGWGLLEVDLDSGEVPVLALGKITGVATQMILDRSLYLYGTLDADLDFSHVQGAEGSREFGRLAPWTVDEIR